jgi:hypothetical protein
VAPGDVLVQEQVEPDGGAGGRIGPAASGEGEIPQSEPQVPDDPVARAGPDARLAEQDALFGVQEGIEEIGRVD